MFGSRSARFSDGRSMFGSCGTRLSDSGVELGGHGTMVSTTSFAVATTKDCSGHCSNDQGENFILGAFEEVRLDDPRCQNYDDTHRQSFIIISSDSMKTQEPKIIFLQEKQLASPLGPMSSGHVRHSTPPSGDATTWRHS
jgi:hypothetical protein